MAENEQLQERSEEERYRATLKALLADVQALELLLERGEFEEGPRRIGAEQEMFLVDAGMRPAPVSMKVLERAKDPRLTYELARFNLEANATPLLFSGDCFSLLHRELDELVALVSQSSSEVGASVLLTGILPTLSGSDLTLENMTPLPRYQLLNDVGRRQRGGAFRIQIKGAEELHVEHDNVMVEACNTSFQLHYQVAPQEFPAMYNIAQFVTAPVLAAAVNSPVFLGKRLWSETRIALFESAVDTRSGTHQHRGLPSRVNFGRDWLHDSVLELFREQIARFRIMLPVEAEEDSVRCVQEGGVPELHALRLHSGTVWSWNRACYGPTRPRPHLRIENRALPAGPTVIDEVANAAFYYGLLSAAAVEYGNIASTVPFSAARDNFFAAARQGLRAPMTWRDGKTHIASALILEELLPLAESGLQAAAVATADIDKYLGILRERVEKEVTGAAWSAAAWAAMGSSDKPDVRARALAAHMLDEQRKGTPVHLWGHPTEALESARRESFRRVGQFMSTDLFTVQERDLIDLAASVMDWRHVKHVPVEDDHGRLVGIVTYRNLLRLIGRGLNKPSGEPIEVQEIMKRDPVTATPETSTLEAMQLMREHRVGCLPVVVDGRLVGIVTQTDLIEVSAGFLEDHLKRGQ